MIDVNKLRNGTAFEKDGAAFLVLKYEFTKMGRGKGNIKVKVRNLKTGAVTTMTFITGNKVEQIKLERKKLQYLYSDGNNSVFMDPVSFEQIEIDNQVLAEQRKFFIDEMEVDVLFWDSGVTPGQATPLSVELPVKMEYTVKETGPSEKGNSVSNMYKPATLDNGLQVKIPLFIKIGEKVKIDTRTGEYMSRV